MDRGPRSVVLLTSEYIQTDRSVGYLAHEGARASVKKTKSTSFRHVAMTWLQKWS